MPRVALALRALAVTTALGFAVAGWTSAEASVTREAVGPASPATGPALATQAGRLALPPAAHPVVSTVQLPGSAFVGSTPDDGDLGGFGASDNLPAKVDAAGGALMLIVDTAAEPAWRGRDGVRVWLANGADEAQTFTAQDSRLSVVQQARIDGEWRDIEHLPSSWCGNSYHQVTLPPDHAWALDLPRYGGPIAVELRVALRLPGDVTLHSAVFTGGLTQGQIDGEQGSYTPTNVMDPTVGW